MKKKEHFAKHFAVRKIFLELQCLADDLVDFLELSMFIKVSLPEIFYLMKWVGDLDMEKTFF